MGITYEISIYNDTAPNMHRYILEITFKNTQTSQHNIRPAGCLLHKFP